MTDQRCTCGNPGCHICSPIHRPWEPKAGTALDAEDGRYPPPVTPWWLLIRQYLFVMLSAIVGGIVGGYAALFAFTH